MKRHCLLCLVNNRKENVMDLEGLISKISEAAQPEYWRFVAENDGDCCEKCKRFDGKVFSDEDPAKPELPIHPNCRCKFIKQNTPGNNVAPTLSPMPETKLLAKNNSTNRQRLNNLKDATITALEMKYLPTGIGEMIGGVKVASIAVTDYGIWAGRARNVVSKSKKLNDDEKLNIYGKLANALAKKDIRTILLIHEKYK